MKKHARSKYLTNPRDFGIYAQYSTPTSEALFFPERVPSHTRKSIESVAKKQGKEGYFFFEFTDVYRFNDFLTEEMQTHTDDESSKTGSESFTGTKSLQASMDLAVNGDQEMIDYVKEQTYRTLLDNNDLIAAPFDVHRNVEGLFFDVGLYLTGEPEAFYEEADSYIPDKCLDVHICCDYSGGNDKDDVKEQLKNIVAAIAILEASGHRVAVHSYWLPGSQGDNDYPSLGLYKKIKDYRHPINLAILTGLTHPGFFRRCVFRMIELVGADTFGYGHPLHTEEGRDDRMFYLDRDSGSFKDVIAKIKKHYV